MPEVGTIAIAGARWFESGVGGMRTTIVVQEGVVAAIGPDVAVPAGAEVIDGHDAVVCPGFLDLHCHLRVPGQPEKETMATATRAAAAGGFTRLVAMPNTAPPVDRVEVLAEVQRQAAMATVRVLPTAAVTLNLEGEALTDMVLLEQFGAVAFTDDGRNLYGADLAGRAVALAARLGTLVMVHAQDPRWQDGEVHGGLAAQFGLRDWPAEAETAVVQALIEASRRSGGRVHVQHVSCAETIPVLRAARAEGLPVTSEVTPHHLALTSDAVVRDGRPDPLAKVNPPLRTEADRAALVAAFMDGTIDAIATDHAPHEAASKAVPFADASFGISGLETALGLCLRLVARGELTLERLVDGLTVAPQRVLRPGAARPAIRAGKPADLTVFAPDETWTVDPVRFHSLGHNTPLGGETLPGCVRLTIAAGRVAHQAEAVEVA